MIITLSSQCQDQSILVISVLLCYLCRLILTVVCQTRLVVT